MSHANGTVRTCPDCGGILQLTEPERLTSAEVALAPSEEDPHRSYQCLLCGYSEDLALAAVAPPR
jgi:hypothetical protein